MFDTANTTDERLAGRLVTAERLASGLVRRPARRYDAQADGIASILASLLPTTSAWALREAARLAITLADGRPPVPGDSIDVHDLAVETLLGLITELEGRDQ